MAERIVSPGVFTRENDMSYLAQGVGQIGAAFIGPFKQGPAFVPTIVRSQSEFQQVFGIPDGTYYTEYAVQNYLQETGLATIVRVAGIGGYKQEVPYGIVAEDSNGPQLVGVLFSSYNGEQTIGFTGVTVTSLGQSGSFTINDLVISQSISASILPRATNDLNDVFGESPFGAKPAYAYTYFEHAAASYTGSIAPTVVTGIELPVQDFTYDAVEAATPTVKSQLISGQRYDLFHFVTLGHGTPYNNMFKIGVSNVKAAGEDPSTNYSTFTVTVRKYDDTDKRKSVYETFSNVNLDANSANYIARRIGDKYVTIDNAGKITENGDYSNKSSYVRVVVSEPGTFPMSASPFAHAAYINPIATDLGDEILIPAVVLQTKSSDNTAASNTYYSGFDFETAGVAADNNLYLKPIPDGALAGANLDFGFDSQLSYEMTGSNIEDMAKRQFILAFQGGFDGLNPTVKNGKGNADSNLNNDWGAGNTQGFDCTTSASSGSIAYFKAINAVSNPDEWDINMIVTPGIVRSLHSAVTTAVIDMCESRQDCFYLADFDDVSDTIQDSISQAAAVDSNYVGTYYPWMKTIDNNTNKLLQVPPSVLLPAVYASNDRVAAEWYAPAGLNRGGITGAVSVLNRLTHAERDVLYEGKVNPIAAFPGQGIVAFGQKTLQTRASALDRINVRRLLINLKKFVASTSRYLVFEQNTAQTRNKFINTVKPYLEAVQQKQGLYAFKVVMDETNNTPDVIDRNILAGSIFLQPAKTAEFIVIDFNIMPTGASFSA